MKPKSPTLYSSDNMNISKSFHSKEGDFKEVKESKKIKVIPKTKKTKKWFFTANIECTIVAIDLSLKKQIFIEILWLESRIKSI